MYVPDALVFLLLSSILNIRIIHSIEKLSEGLKALEKRVRVLVLKERLLQSVDIHF